VLDINTNTMHALNITGLQSPWGAALSPDGHSLVVVNTGSSTTPAHTVQVIDTVTGTLRRAVTLTGTPYGVAITPDGSRAWITTINPSELWRITLP